MCSPGPKSTNTSTASVCKKGRTKRSTANRGPLSENRYYLLCAAVRGNPEHSPQVDEFIKQNMSFLYSGSCKRSPNFTYDEENQALYRLSGEKRKEVVHKGQAREIFVQLHCPSGRACRKDGINGLVKAFCHRYECKGIRKIAQEVKTTCTGTCQQMKNIKTTNPPPQLIRTETVMERVQIDLTEMYGPKSPLLAQSNHKYRFILSVMDCFSKYCWLTPLTNKSADTVVHVLHDIFTDYGCPLEIHSDNGGEFCAKITSKLFTSLGVKIIHGRAYHPQSQGQVERLNKKIKEKLRYRLLDFSPEEQSSIWPFLLPEITYMLNNTWHVALNTTPFEVFFGRPSRHFNVGGCTETAIWPTDKFLSLMSYSPTTSPGPTMADDCIADDLWESDMEQGTLPLNEMKIKFKPIGSENLSEIQESLHQLSKQRKHLQIKVKNATEKKFFQNYLACCKGIKKQQFMVGDRVWFHKPDQHGMVVVPNIKGTVREVLPCNYYRVAYQSADGCERTVTLFATMMAMNCQASVEQESNTLTDTTDQDHQLPLSSIPGKVCEYALRLREQLTSKNYDYSMGEGGNQQIKRYTKRRKPFLGKP